MSTDNIVFKNEKCNFEKVFKIFKLTDQGLVEPINYSHLDQRLIFSEYRNENEALEALFNSELINPFSNDEFVVLPAYQIRPEY